MKSSIFILFFILCGLVTAQNYEEKFHLADSLLYDQKSYYDRKLMITNFEKHYDRKAIWVEETKIEL